MPRLFWLIVILILMVVGCKAPRPETSPLKSPPLTPAVGDSSYPVLAGPATSIPLPRAGLGTVTGTLVQMRTGTRGELMAGAVLFLAPLIYSADGTSSIAALDKGSAPMSVTDEMGRFVMSNVEVREYALIYSSGTTEFPLKDPNSSEDLVIVVVADRITDLGEIYIDMP